MLPVSILSIATGQPYSRSAETVAMSRNLTKVTPCDVSGQQPTNADLRSRTRSLNSRGNVTPASDRMLSVRRECFAIDALSFPLAAQKLPLDGRSERSDCYNITPTRG